LPANIGLKSIFLSQFGTSTTPTSQCRFDQFFRPQLENRHGSHRFRMRVSRLIPFRHCFGPSKVTVCFRPQFSAGYLKLLQVNFAFSFFILNPIPPVPYYLVLLFMAPGNGRFRDPRSQSQAHFRSGVKNLEKSHFSDQIKKIRT